MSQQIHPWVLLFAVGTKNLRCLLRLLHVIFYLSTESLHTCSMDESRETHERAVDMERPRVFLFNPRRESLLHFSVRVNTPEQGRQKLRWINDVSFVPVASILILIHDQSQLVLLTQYILYYNIPCKTEAISYKHNCVCVNVMSFVHLPH